jgi:hypothetical protein
MTEKLIWAELTEKQQQKILTDHLKWMRDEKGDVRAYLSGAYLSGAWIKVGSQEKEIATIWLCGPGGSRRDFLVFIKTTDGGLYLSTGCQHNVEVGGFLKMVKNTHDGNKHAKYYKTIIATAKKVLR